MKELDKARKQFDRYMAFDDAQEAAKARAIDTAQELLDVARAKGATEEDILRALHPSKGANVTVRSPGYEYHGKKGKVLETNGDFATVKIGRETHELYLSCIVENEE